MSLLNWRKCFITSVYSAVLFMTANAHGNAFARIRKPDEVIQELQKRLNESEVSEKAGIYIGLIHQYILKQDFKSAQDTYSKFKKTKLSVPSQLQLVANITFAEVLESEEKFSEALIFLKKQKLKPDDLLAPYVAEKFLTNLVSLELYQEGFEFFTRQNSLIKSSLTKANIEQPLLLLGKGLLERGDSENGMKVISFLASLFPTTPTSREAFYIYSNIECASWDYDDVWKTDEEKKKHARLITFKLGNEKDIREFVLALSGIDVEKLIPKERVDSLLLEEKESLLGHAQTLVAMREHELANTLLKYLSGAKVYGGTFQEKQVTILYGRTYNSVNKPLEAAKIYKALLDKPGHTIAKSDILDRYITSLHYARKYKEEAVEWKKWLDSVNKRTSVVVNALWADYLGRNHAEVIDFGKKMLQAKYVSKNVHPQIKYWMARAHEKLKQTKEASALFEELKESHSVYGLLSKLRSPKEELVASTVTLRAMPAPGEFNVELSTEEKTHLKKFYKISNLSTFGLDKFARREVRGVSPRNRSDANLLAKLAYKVGDYKDSSALIRKWTIGYKDNVSFSEVKTNIDAWSLGYPLAYEQIVMKAAKEFDVRPDLLWSVMRQESNYNQDATSWVGATGLMQIMPQTGTKIAKLRGEESFHPIELYDPEKNISYGAWYLRRLLTYYNNNLPLAVAAYNGGPVAVDRWIGDTSDLEIDEFIENIPYRETKNYVWRVLANMDMYRKIHPNIGSDIYMQDYIRLPTTRPKMDMF